MESLHTSSDLQHGTPSSSCDSPSTPNRALTQFHLSTLVSRSLPLKAWLPVALFVLLFALESTPIFGSNHTTEPIHRLASLLVGTKLDKHWAFYHHVLRKMCHFLGCGIFSMICFRGLSISLRNHPSKFQLRLRNHTLAIAATILVASCDEIHQCFMPNRTGSFTDVLLDTSGAAAFQAALFLTSFAALAWTNYRNIDFFADSGFEQEQAA